ncbi:MAG: hypothetical protein CVV08_22120 [Gammaproteobacteria bacterium HGW-Gammaproteobacteria-12]|nr:MAG: hypothetical protein CVV08_22120 [Gammaproteobacteria bacterium HGW-Gammaproteobacteria-12]
MESLESLNGENVEKPSFEGTQLPNVKDKKSDDTAAGIIGLLLIALFVYWVWGWAFGDDFYYKKKAVLQAEVNTMVKNGADLDSIKHHFFTAFSQEWGLIDSWTKDESDYYRNDVSLLVVLKDIQNSAYLSEEVLVDIAGVRGLMEVYQYRNPFDGLEPNQKDLFENIRVKLGDGYGVVAGDLNKLSDEITMKNGLVNQYLSDSKTSLYISVASLAFGLFLPFIGVLLRRRRMSGK